MSRLVALLFIAAVAAATLWSPFAGLLAYLWLDFMRPHDFAVELRGLRPMLVIGGVTVAAALWRERWRWRSMANGSGVRQLLPVFALVAVLAASAIFSVDRSVSFAVVVTACKLFVLVCLLAALVTDEQRQRAVFWVIAMSLGILAAAAIVQAVERNLLHEFQAALVVEGPAGLHDGPLRDNNDLARILALGVPLWWILAAASGPPWSRLVAMLGLAVTVFAIECTFSRSGFVGLAVGVAVLCLGRRPGWRGAVAYAVLVAAFLVVSPQAYLDRLSTTARPMADQSMRGRAAIWQDAAPLMMEHPILGQGPGTFQYGLDGRPNARRPSHNITLELMFETGFVGLAAYAWMMIATLLRLRRIRRDDGDPWAARVAIALTASLLAYLAAGQALSNPFQSPPFVIVGLAIALERAGSIVPAAHRTSRPAPARWLAG